MTKLTVHAAKQKFGSAYNVAKQLGKAPSTVTRWGKYVPEQYVEALLSRPASRLQRGGAR